MKAPYQRVLIRISVTNSGVRPRFYRSATGGVVIEYIFQRRNAAVVHIRRGDGDVSQRGRFEFSDIRSGLRVFIRAYVRSRIGEHASQIVKTRVVKFDLSSRIALRHSRVTEIESAVTAKARELLAEEQDFSALCRFRHRAVFAAIVIPVIR